MKKEECLDRSYQSGKHWKSVNRNIVLAAMQQYADSQCEAKDKRIKGLENGIREALKYIPEQHYGQGESVDNEDYVKLKALLTPPRKA